MDNNNTFTTLETKNFAMNVMNLSCSWLADIFVNHVVWSLGWEQHFWQKKNLKFSVVQVVRLVNWADIT